LSEKAEAAVVDGANTLHADRYYGNPGKGPVGVRGAPPPGAFVTASAASEVIPPGMGPGQALLFFRFRKIFGEIGDLCLGLHRLCTQNDGVLRFRLRVLARCIGKAPTRV
jgi:hypothetical protein